MSFRPGGHKTQGSIEWRSRDLLGVLWMEVIGSNFAMKSIGCNWPMNSLNYFRIMLVWYLFQLNRINIIRLWVEFWNLSNLLS